MFAKVFSQIFDSSIAENYSTRHVFVDLLVMADSKGVVDMTMDAISRRTNVPSDIVRKAVMELMEPDPFSRSKEEEGRRIVLIDSHRDWGWQIVNYEHYRELRDEEARKAYFRDYKREYRAALKGKKRKSKTIVGQSTLCPSVSNSVQLCPTMSTQGEGEGEGEELKKITSELGGGQGEPPQKRRSAPVLADFEKFWAQLHKDNRKYKGRAREAWLKAIKNGATPEQILSAVDDFNRSERKRRHQNDYRATHPATWLNGGGFEDGEVIEPEETETDNDEGWIDKSIYG